MKKANGNRIILVEDSAIITRDLKHNLTSFGYNVISTFQDGEDFLATESQLEYDFIIMDIYLAKELNGVETIEKLYKTKHKPVLFLTGTTEKKIIDRAKALNPLGYLLKPYTAMQLQITFEMALQKLKIDKELRKHKVHLEEIIKERTKELYLAKEKAEKSEKLKTAFLHNMSHEIRTPLNAIIGFTELLINPKISEDKKTEFVNYIQNSTSSLLSLVDNVWQLSHIQIGEFVPVISKCYVNQIIDEIQIKIQKQAHQEKKKIEIKIQKFAKEPDFFVYSDPTIIKRIILNLASNAVKYTINGSVSISYKQIEKSLIINIIDTGIGIAKDKLEVIFDLFYKIDGNSEKLFRGAGLGLALAKSLVDSIDGEINVSSEINIGSKFTVKIPLKDNNNTHIQKQENFAIIHSNEQQKDIFENFLSFHHLKYSFFSNSNDFFKLHESGITYSSVIINVLNKKDGLTILKRITQIEKNPVILLLQYEFLEYFTTNCESTEKNYFIIKPIEEEQLIKIFKQLNFI